MQMSLAEQPVGNALYEGWWRWWWGHDDGYWDQLIYDLDGRALSLRSDGIDGYLKLAFRVVHYALQNQPIFRCTRTKQLLNLAPNMVRNHAPVDCRVVAFEYRINLLLPIIGIERNGLDQEVTSSKQQYSIDVRGDEWIADRLK